MISASRTCQWAGLRHRRRSFSIDLVVNRTDTIASVEQTGGRWGKR